MKFSIWLVAMLALMPVFVLFVGLSAAGGLGVPIEWIILALIIGAATVVGWQAIRELNGPPP